MGYMKCFLGSRQCSLDYMECFPDSKQCCLDYREYFLGSGHRSLGYWESFPCNVLCLIYNVFSEFNAVFSIL